MATLSVSARANEVAAITNSSASLISRSFMRLPAFARVSVNKLVVILRASATKSRSRLEGWKQSPCVWPSFETTARERARSPQDDGSVYAPVLATDASRHTGELLLRQLEAEEADGVAAEDVALR